MCGGRPILEHMAKVAATAAAVHFRARHPEAAVAGGLDRPRNRIVEAWPAGAALELGLRDEQWLPAAYAGEGACALLIIKRAAAGRFRAVSAHDRILLGREQEAPLFVRAGDRIGFGVGLRVHWDPRSYQQAIYGVRSREILVAPDMLQDRLPRPLLVMDKGSDLGGRHRLVKSPKRDEALVHRRIFHGPGKVVADLAHERRWRAGGRDHRLPARRHKAWQGFRDC